MKCLLVLVNSECTAVAGSAPVLMGGGSSILWAMPLSLGAGLVRGVRHRMGVCEARGPACGQLPLRAPTSWLARAAAAAMRTRACALCVRVYRSLVVRLGSSRKEVGRGGREAHLLPHPHWAHPAFFLPILQAPLYIEFFAPPLLIHATMQPVLWLD